MLKIIEYVNCLFPSDMFFFHNFENVYYKIYLKTEAKSHTLLISKLNITACPSIQCLLSHVG